MGMSNFEYSIFYKLFINDIVTRIFISMTQYLSIQYVMTCTGIMSRNEVYTFEVGQCKCFRILPVSLSRPIQLLPPLRNGNFIVWGGIFLNDYYKKKKKRLFTNLVTIFV